MLYIQVTVEPKKSTIPVMTVYVGPIEEEKLEDAYKTVKAQPWVIGTQIFSGQPFEAALTSLENFLKYYTRLCEA